MITGNPDGHSSFISQGMEEPWLHSGGLTPGKTQTLKKSRPVWRSRPETQDPGAQRPSASSKMPRAQQAPTSGPCTSVGAAAGCVGVLHRLPWPRLWARVRSLAGWKEAPVGLGPTLCHLLKGKCCCCASLLRPSSPSWLCCVLEPVECGG